MTPATQFKPNADKQPAYGCAHCDARWSGAGTCHCGKCHETFSGLKSFDAHREGSHARGTRKCLIPASAGLVQADNRPYPCWAVPEGVGDDPEGD